MNSTLWRGTIVSLPEPFTYLVRLTEGREVEAQPSRLHFVNRTQDIDFLRELRPGCAVTLRGRDAMRAWVVRVADSPELWGSATDPAILLETVRDHTTVRALRQFALACCGEVAELLPVGPHRRLLDVLRRSLDGTQEEGELADALAAGEAEEAAASDRAEEAESDPVEGPRAGAQAKAIWAVRIAATVADEDYFEVALDSARACTEAAGLHARAIAAGHAMDPEEAQSHHEAAAAARQADLVRRLFGGPDAIS